MITNKKAFSLVEILIALVIMSIVSAMALTGMITLSKGIKRPKDIAKSKTELRVFVNGIYKFINNSFSVYLVDPASTDTPPACNYLSTTFANADSRQDVLYMIKDENDTTGSIVYNTIDKQFEYYQTSTVAPQIMLKDVYRLDASWDENGNLSSSGVEPIFKFPHKTSLYNSDYSPIRPKVVIIQFSKIVSKGGSEYKQPLAVPMTLMIEVNVSTFETV